MKNSPHDVQTKGGGVKGFLNNVQKNCTFLTGRLPLCISIKIISIILTPRFLVGDFYPRMATNRLFYRKSLFPFYHTVIFSNNTDYDHNDKDDNDVDENDVDDDELFAETCKKEVNENLHPGVLCAGNLKKGGVDSCQVMPTMMMTMTIRTQMTTTMMIMMTIYTTFHKNSK